MKSKSAPCPIASRQARARAISKYVRFTRSRPSNHSVRKPISSFWTFSGGVNAVDARRTILIDDDAVVDPDLAADKQIDHRLDTNADDNKIAWDAESRGGDNPRDSTVALKGLHRIVVDGMDAVRRVQ